MVAIPCQFCGVECKGVVDQESGVSALSVCVSCMKALRDKWNQTFGVKVHSFGPSSIEVEWQDVKWILDHAERDVPMRTMRIEFTDKERRFHA